MDIKQLIDGTDFEDLNQLSKRWKKESHSHSIVESQAAEAVVVMQKRSNLEKTSNLKENVSQQANSQRISNQYADVPTKKREVMPQIIDEDTQHFRNRLQHLLNTFKTDAVSEFMSMKKCMLECQKDTIKNDTQKYLTLYEEKHKELLEAKDKLITMTSELQRKGMQVQLMSSHIAKLNQRIQITRYLSRPFALLYENKEREKMLKFKMAEAAKFDNRRIKIKAVNGWRNIYREAKREKEQQTNNNKVEMQVNSIVSRFQKEMEMLKDKLAQANRKNQEYENNKLQIQENLKKAFLRGISSMNMQAMGIFGTELQDQRKSTTDHQIDTQANLSYVDPTSMAFSRSVNHNLNQTTANIFASNPSVVVSKPKVQSKDHKWKQAPILGMEEKQQIQQPRPQLVRPTTEAKVIRVMDGRSAVESLSSKEIGKRTTNQTALAVKNEPVRKKI